MSNRVQELLMEGPTVNNVGLGDFAKTLRAQGVEAVHVEWTPPAGGDPELIDLLDQLL